MITLDQAKAIIGSRVMVTKDGQYRVKVTNTTPYIREDGTAVTIVNFNAMTQHQLGEAKKHFDNGDLTKGLQQSLSMSTRQNDFTPQKGELVNVVVETRTTKNGVTGQFVTNCTPLVTEVASNVNVDQLFGGNEEVVEAEEVTAEAEAEAAAEVGEG